MQTSRVGATQTPLAASHSTTAPQNPRRRQKFHDGVSRTRVACKRSAMAFHKPRWRRRTPRQRRRIHDGAKNSATAPHEPGWHENDPRSRFTSRVRLHSIRDSRKKTALPPPRARWHDFFLRQRHTRHNGGKESPFAQILFRVPTNLSIVVTECGDGAVSRRDRRCWPELTANAELRRSDSPRVEGQRDGDSAALGDVSTCTGDNPFKTAGVTLTSRRRTRPARWPLPPPAARPQAGHITH